jgi:hypothetical protein
VAGDTAVGIAIGTVAPRFTTAEPTTETAHGMEATMAAAPPLMEPTEAHTPLLAITPRQALTREARQPQRHMALKRSDRPTTHTRGRMGPHIKVPTPIRTGEARRSRRTDRLSTRSITRTQMEPLGQPKAQTVTSMRPRTAMPTKTLGVAGRRQALPMLHTVGEEAADRTITAAVHRPSAAGAILAIRAGAPSLRVPRAGAAVVEVEDGAVEGSMAAAVVKSIDQSQRPRETAAIGGS